MRCFVDNEENYQKLTHSLITHNLDSYLDKSKNVRYQNKVYTHIATYSQELSTKKKNELFLKTALTTLVTFGFALLSEKVRDDWSTVISGKKISQIYLEKGLAKKINGMSIETFRLHNQGLANVAPPTTIQGTKKPTLVNWQQLWDGSINGLPYNAFTDLIYYNNQFLCCFRESHHPQQGDNGKIRILASKDSFTWTSVADIALEGYDLRDPKLSVTPEGRLLLNLGATLWSNNRKTETLNSAVAFSSDGINWGPVQVLPYTGQWLWRVTWNQNTAYAMAYSFNGNGGFQMQLMSSPDAINYTTIQQFQIPGNPTEATLRFLADNTMVALVRTTPGVIGTAQPPYTDWSWYNTNAQLGGPDFLILDNGAMWASSRAVNGNKEKCILASMSADGYQPIITFPSKGDSGYTGMVYKDGKLYVSYYTSLTGKSTIYLATIQL